MTNNKGCYFCGPIKNCAPYLASVFQNIKILGDKVFDGNYKIILFYDHSKDSTLQILKQYQDFFGGPDKFLFYINKTPVSKYRTHNIAYARNFCLKYIYDDIAAQKYEYFMMMDFDDVNANKTVHPEILQNYLTEEYDDKWDALSFNTAPFYYDIWALSIWPYCYSYNHYNNNDRFYNIIKDYITDKLRGKSTKDLVQCISAFNGAAIYRINAFKNCTYNGTPNVKAFPLNFLLTHSKAANSHLVFKKYPTVDGHFEDCEHREFHLQGTQKNGAKIRISPLCLFD